MVMTDFSALSPAGRHTFKWCHSLGERRAMPDMYWAGINSMPKVVGLQNYGRSSTDGTKKPPSIFPAFLPPRLFSRHKSTWCAPRFTAWRFVAAWRFAIDSLLLLLIHRNCLHRFWGLAPIGRILDPQPCYPWTSCKLERQFLAPCCCCCCRTSTTMKITKQHPTISPPAYPR